MASNSAISGNPLDMIERNAPQDRAELPLRCDTGIDYEVLLRRETEFVYDLTQHGDAGVVDVVRTIPTRLPEALRAASKRASDHAADPFNKLDYNPYIADEWAIVAAEFQSLANKLERRFRALFDGKSARYGATHLQ